MKYTRFAKNITALLLCALFASAGSEVLAPLGPASLAACRMLGLDWAFPLFGTVLSGVVFKNYAGALHSLCYFCLSYLFKNRRGSTKGQGLMLMWAALLTAPYFYISSWELCFTGLSQLSAATVMAAAFFRCGRCIRRLLKDRPVKSGDITAVLLCQGVLCGVLAVFGTAAFNPGSFFGCIFALMWSASPHCVTAAAIAGAGAGAVTGDAACLAAAVTGAMCSTLLDGYGRWGRGLGFALGGTLAALAVESSGLWVEISLAVGIYLVLPIELPFSRQDSFKRAPLALLEAKNRAAASALLGISGMISAGEGELAQRQIQAVSRSLLHTAPVEKGLSLECAVATLPKAGCRRAGDTAEVRELPFGKLVMLSDGMGSGASAQRESKEAVSIIGDLISSGVEEKEALYCANRLLMEKGEFDMYATVDVMTFHYATGVAEFFKLGACPTFVVRGNEVTELAGETLPIGIVAGAHPAVKELALRPNDTIFMMTDGVYDALVSELVDMLRGLAAHAPHLAARHLVQQAARNGRFDDMSVIAMRVKR